MTTPYRIASELTGAVPPGSRRGLSRVASGIDPEQIAYATVPQPAQQATLRLREGTQLPRFFGGLELLWPALTPSRSGPPRTWRPGGRPAM